MICCSFRTFLTSFLSTHFSLFMYFMAYIFLVSFFCTMHTWGERSEVTHLGERSEVTHLGERSEVTHLGER
ncbi:hypothetical protein EYF80_067027 [Liparis tanakae]|uniref:Uncharacterized protein n=1 Tax=Liparis tanakae TaxID=230148 RepID=A0A4Z2E2A2_9TELE|nr:hypothetical protein EYF80_067027 [Liparis tanakae]